MVDLNGDGHDDVLSGSWPGELYVFAGSAEGFQKAQTVKNAEGKMVHVGKAAAVFAADWDRDGDVDLVIGDKDGHVWFVPNESGTKEQKFGVAAKLRAGDAEIRVEGGNAGPTLADWDGNGTLDLIVGAGNGSVYLFSNDSASGAPTLSAPTSLVDAGSSTDPDGCGARTKPHVTDWNADGQPDLLLGDFAMGRPPEVDLTEEQQAELNRLLEERTALAQQVSPIFQRIATEALESVGVELPEDPQEVRNLYGTLTPEQRKAMSEAMQVLMKDNKELADLRAKQQELHKKIRTLRPSAPVLGRVWVFLRPAKAPDDSSATNQ